MDLFSIPTHLADFKKLLAEMNKKLDRIVTVVEHTHGVVSELEHVMEKLSEKTHTTGEQFTMCAKAFYQVRDACHVLREDLGTACGQLVEQSWLDEDNLLT
jgi:hypothetical protein